MITLEKDNLKAVFDPENGMTLTSFVKEGQEILKDARMIGPHFGMRRIVPQMEKPPRGEPGADPFPYGIARFAPWTVEKESETIQVKLSGKSEWGGHTLAEWEGQQFEMTLCASIEEESLQMRLSIVSEFDSLIGLECVTPITSASKVKAPVQPKIYIHAKLEPWPSEWERDEKGAVSLSLVNPYFNAFLPFPDPLKAQISTPTVQLSYVAESQENSWILKKEPEAREASIMALTAQNPWRPNLSVSTIDIQIQ